MSKKKNLVWTWERENALREMWESGIPTIDIAPMFNERFGTKCTQNSMSNRAALLNLVRPAAFRSETAKQAKKHATIWQHPDALPELERLWTTTAMPPGEIAAYLNATFGMTLTGDRLVDHARKRGFRRSTDQRKNGDTRHRPKPISDAERARAERAAINAILNPPRQPDNGRLFVVPGTYRVPVGGFRMGRTI